MNTIITRTDVNAGFLTRRWNVFALPIIFLCGCASAPPTHENLNAEAPEEKAQVERRLNEILDAAARKDLPRLDSYHFYGPKFTKFGLEQNPRQDAETARKAEHDGLGAINGLSMQSEDLHIDVFGDVAIATFLLNSAFDAPTGRIEKKARSTLVFVKDAGAWKITHEHFSAAAPPSR